MFAAALRPAAFATRAALRPVSRYAVRTISTTPARFSGHAEPSIFGTGGKDGEVPTEESQATGLERLQVLGEMEGVNVFDYQPLDASRIGTKASPIKVFSWEPERTVGCTGSPAESHELHWINLTSEKNRRCPECGSVYALDYHADPEGDAHGHAHH